MHARAQRDELACDRIREGLEDGRISHRFHPAETLGERAERRVIATESIEARQIEIESEHPRNRSGHLIFHLARMPRDNPHFDFGTRAMSGLRYRQFDRRAADHQNAKPDTVVKQIDFVMRAASERPHSQVESEGRPRPKSECELWHWRRMANL